MKFLVSFAEIRRLRKVISAEAISIYNFFLMQSNARPRKRIICIDLERLALREIKGKSVYVHQT